MKLHLHVKTCYFDEIKDGIKTEEFRLATRYWQRRIMGRDYDGVMIYNAYNPGAANRIEFPWRGWTMQTLTHPHFGPDPVKVFVIKLEVTK